MAGDDWHLDDETAAGLITNTLPPRLRNRAVAHLIHGCEPCRGRVAKLMQELELRAEDFFTPLLEAGVERTEAATEMAALVGQVVWDQLVRLPAGKRLAAIQKDRRYHHEAVLRQGLEGVRQAANTRPQEAAELALLLPALAEVAEGADRLQRFDWRAEATLVLAHAKRAAGDFRGAEAALDRAEAFLAYGTGDPVDQAVYGVHRAKLLADLGEFEAAVAQLGMAIPLFQLAGDPNSVAKVLLHQALILRMLDPQRAFDLAEEGLTQLDKDREPRAELSAHYTMAYCQAELGDTDEAEGILATYRYLFHQFPDVGTRCSLAWLEARIRARQGKLAEAEHRMRGVQAEYLAHGFRLEAVLSTLDLVELLVLQDRTAEGLYLVEEILPSLRAWRLHKATLAVVALLGNHLQERTAEVETFRVLADRLRRTWHLNGASGLPAA
jgi:tetratricopeptide (TPR) repeat protein